MSYRSDVKVLITLPQNKTKEEIIEDIEKAIGGELNELFEKAYYTSNVDYAGAKWNYLQLETYYIKWYRDYYEDVKGFMDWLYSFNDNYNSGGVSFIRVGESYDDTEEIIMGDPMEFLELERNIIGFETDDTEEIKLG